MEKFLEISHVCPSPDSLLMSKNFKEILIHFNESKKSQNPEWKDVGLEDVRRNFDLANEIHGFWKTFKICIPAKLMEPMLEIIRYTLFCIRDANWEAFMRIWTKDSRDRCDNFSRDVFGVLLDGSKHRDDRFVYLEKICGDLKLKNKQCACDAITNLRLILSDFGVGIEEADEIKESGPTKKYRLYWLDKK